MVLVVVVIAAVTAGAVAIVVVVDSGPKFIGTAVWHFRAHDQVMLW